MCKRFVEDLANKIIEKIDLETLETKKLRQTIGKCIIIIDQRQKDLNTELEKVYLLENYRISKGHKNSITIETLSQRSYLIHIYYNHCNKTHGTHDSRISPNAYRFHSGNQTESFLTKEELLNHLIIKIEIKDKEKLYNICLKKINIVEELEINYTFVN